MFGDPHFLAVVETRRKVVECGLHLAADVSHEVAVEHDGFADLFLGYEPYFRVSWANTMGGLDNSSIVDNTNHWSGGHVSVDPEHVPGIFFSNRAFETPSKAGLIDIGPTMLKRYGLDPASTDMDGNVLPFVDLTP